MPSFWDYWAHTNGERLTRDKWIIWNDANWLGRSSLSWALFRVDRYRIKLTGSEGLLGALEKTKSTTRENYERKLRERAARENSIPSPSISILTSGSSRGRRRFERRVWNHCSARRIDLDFDLADRSHWCRSNEHPRSEKEGNVRNGKFYWNSKATGKS